MMHRIIPRDNRQLTPILKTRSLKATIVLTTETALTKWPASQNIIKLIEEVND
jgi:hypothetical protein